MTRDLLTPEAKAAQLARIDKALDVDTDDFLWWLDQKKWNWHQLERGEYGMTLQEAQLLYVMEDPVLWCKAFLTDPDTDQPYTFFDYQIPSVRAWHQNVVHQDGAEVGKTREIVALLLWGAVTGNGCSIRNPWFLVGAPQQTHLDEIIMAIEEHCGIDEDGHGSGSILGHFWRKPKRTPHTMLRLWGAMGRSRIYFRPGGHDGEAFRGVHVNAGQMMDEAAKIKAKVVWSEFYRAGKPGCVQRVYSVPDGDNTTDYYRMTMEAVPNLKPGVPGTRLFHWQKPMMPAPFWSPERKADFVRRYGGEDQPGYQRNVLGLHGQQENPVFSWELLMRNVRDIPEFRLLDLKVNDQDGTLRKKLSRITLDQADGRKHGQPHVVYDTEQSVAPFLSQKRDVIHGAVKELVQEAFDAPAQGLYWLGADLGFSKDPTEIRLWQEVGEDLRLLLRIRARGMTYDLQAALLFYLDLRFGFQAQLGVDFGNAGSAVVQMLQRNEEFADGRYEDRLTGFQFSAALDNIDESGEPTLGTDMDSLEPSDEQKAMRLPAKELATNLILTRMQRGTFQMPYDAEVLGHYSNHTAREGAKQRIYSKKDDHTIDADRVMMLRKAFSEMLATADVFASGVQRREAA